MPALKFFHTVTELPLVESIDLSLFSFQFYSVKSLITSRNRTFFHRKHSNFENSFNVLHRKDKITSCLHEMRTDIFEDLFYDN